MKRLISICIVVSLAFLGCEERLTSPPNFNLGANTINSTHPNFNIKNPGPVKINTVILPGGYCTEVKYFHAIFGPAEVNRHQTLTIDPEWVIIGGGAEVQPSPGVPGAIPGAFLTESRPDFANNAWVASSKSHGGSGSHYLNITAIGLRVTAGLYMGASALRSVMQYKAVTGAVAPHPTATVTLDPGYTLLGGGACDNYEVAGPFAAGNLLVSSFPLNNTTWSASGKDHKYASSSSITAYAIGIQSSLVNTLIKVTAQYVPSGFGYAPQIVPDAGYVVSCPGGATSYNGFGRMLRDIIIPTDTDTQSVNVISKDHFESDSGNVYGYMIQFKDTGFCL
ncbi:MAG TPA: hypothetical protein VGQ59_21000 [Cyclobacteriaceae bacterium]|jgi:hypothetical protein|nr:hypothetical protein [Cyclobacteriaceae bacterium]